MSVGDKIVLTVLALGAGVVMGVACCSGTLGIMWGVIFGIFSEVIPVGVIWIEG